MGFTITSGGNKNSKGGSFIAAIIFIAVAIGMNYFTADMIAEAKESENWPSTQGIVAESEINSHLSTSDGKTQTMYSAYVRTEYEVDGRQYSTTNINLAGASSTSSRSSVKKKVDLYPVGETVPVYFKPNDPGNAVLEPGMPMLFRILKIVPIVIIVMAALIIIRTILKLAGLITALGFLAAKREKKTQAAPQVANPAIRPATAAATGTAPDTPPATPPTTKAADPKTANDSDDGFSI